MLFAKEIIIWLAIGKNADCRVNIKAVIRWCKIQMNLTSFSLVNFVNECSMKICEILNPYLWWIIKIEEFIDKDVICHVILIIKNNGELILLNCSKLSDAVMKKAIGNE